METIEIKNLTPLISVVSAGKSSFLNVIYNIDFLEVRSGICTKSINIKDIAHKLEKALDFII